MGFKWRLEYEIVEGWRDAYIDYAKIKSAIRDAALSSGGVSARQYMSKNTKKASQYSNRRSSSLESSETPETVAPEAKQAVFTLIDEQMQDVEHFYESTLMKDAESRFYLLQEQLHELELHRKEYDDVRRNINPAILPAFTALRQAKQRLFPESEEGAEQKKVFGSSYKYEPHRLGTAERKLELALCEFYVYLGSIKNYCAINKEGFEKCAKKVEQELGISCYRDYKEKLHKLQFSHAYDLSDLQMQTEALYSESFSAGDQKRAVHHLRALTRPVTARSFATAKSGAYFGIAVILGAFAIYNANHPATRRRIPQTDTLLQIYAAFFLPTFLAFTIGFNLIVWHRARIDVPVVFSFDRRTHLHIHEYFELPTFLLMTLSACMYLSFSKYSKSAPPQMWPIVWLCGTLVFFLNPFPILHHQARWWLIRSLCRVVASGLIQVEFRDFFLGDQLCSVYYSIYNMYLLGCAYNDHFSPGVASKCSPNDTWVTPALASLPSFFRLGHSVRRYYNDSGTKSHLLNAFKYGLTIMYQFLYYNWRIHGNPSGQIFVFFVISATLNAAMSYGWDVRIDWNLLNRGSKHTMLRDKLAYSNHIGFYYLAIVANLPLRFAWLIYLSGNDHTSLKGFMNSLLEVCRRCLWNFLRVDAEHVGNVDDYRAVRDVPLPYEKTAMDRAARRTDPPEAILADNDQHSDDYGQETSPLKKARTHPSYGTIRS